MNTPDLFTLASLTESINQIPALPTKIGNSKLFTPKPISTTQVMIDEKQGKLSLVANTSRRDAGAPAASATRKARSFTTTHLPQRGTLLAEDYQGVRGFGAESEADPIAKVLIDRLQELRNNVDATREYHKICAIRGQILDADGTVIENLYTGFGVSQETVNLSLASNTAPNTKIREAMRKSEKVLGAMLVNGFRAYCSPDFFDALVENAAVKAAYANWQAAQDRLAGDMRSGFTHAGVEWIEYAAQIGDKKFVPDGEAYLFPVAQGIFIEALAPANYLETINTLGKEYYAKAQPLPFDKGYDLEAQSNPLALNLLPAATIKLLKA